MDANFVVDYGSHTVKHTFLSKSDKNPTFDFNAKEDASKAYINDSLDVVQFGKHISEILSETCYTDSGLTISILTDVLIPQWKRELLLKCCFENLGAKRVFLNYSAATALFSAGETTGISIDIGYRSVRIIPIINGDVQTFLSNDIHSVGARNTDNILLQYLPKANDTLLTLLKSSACFIGEEPQRMPTHLTLPDGNNISFPLTPAICREAGEGLLFHASHIRTPDILLDNYQKCLLEFPTLTHWALFGGASVIKGVKDVLHNAMHHAISTNTIIPNQLSVKNPMHAALTGGVIVSQLNTFKSFCIDVAEYIEEGPHRCIRV